MAITLNGTTGITTPDITSEAGLTVDGVSFASGAPANTLVTTSGGNVGIGTSSPTSSLVVAGSASSLPTIDGVHIGTQFGYATIELCGASGSGALIDFTQSGTDYKGRILYSNTSNHMSISTDAAERMRIDSSGNVLVGTTDSALTASAGIKMFPAGSIGVVNTGSNDGYLFYNTTASAYRFFVTAGGTINATNATISAISDQRYKENIRDLDIGLDAVMQLRPRKFDWKEGKGQDIKDCRGFIAQEFEEVFPDLIDEWRDPAPEGEEPYKSVRQDLIPVLVKAIQEQQALITAQQTAIETLEARVAALEAA